MNWFQKLWSNPNTHIFIGLISGVAAAFIPPVYAPIAAALAATFGSAGIALPSLPPTTVTLPASHPAVVAAVAAVTSTAAASPAPVITVPVAVAGGSYHTVDYANLAAALINQFGRAAASQQVDPPKPATPIA